MSNHIRCCSIVAILVSLASGFTSHGMDRRYPDYPIKLTEYRGLSTDQGIEKESSTSNVSQLNNYYSSKDKSSNNSPFSYIFEDSSYNNYFSSSTNSSQRKKGNDPLKSINLLTNIYNFSSKDYNIINAFEGQFDIFLQNPFIFTYGKNKHEKVKKYNCDQSNIFKLNIVNYLFSLDNNLSKKYKQVTKFNKQLNQIPWDNSYYLLLIDALKDQNTPKEFCNIVSGIIKLDYNNNVIDSNNKELSLTIQQFVDPMDKGSKKFKKNKLFFK